MFDHRLLASLPRSPIDDRCLNETITGRERRGPELDQIEQRRMELTSADLTLDHCFPSFPSTQEGTSEIVQNVGLPLSLCDSPQFGDSLDFFLMVKISS